MQKQAKPIPCEECGLQKCPGLRPLEPNQLQYMQEFKQGERLSERGDIIVAQGQVISHLYTVYSGVLIRYRSLDDGRRQIVNFMFPGDLIGLMGAFDEPSSHTIETLLDARLCMFTRKSFTQLIGKHPQLGFDLTWMAAKEEAALEEHIVSLGQRTAKERVAYLAVWLLDRAIGTGLADKKNVLHLPITQAQIADMLGLSLVHTNRTIRALDKEDLVNWKSREICVPDMARTCEYAQYDRDFERVRPFI
ncbi:Crp/Fnr family transcriptional regulator [Qipengyuania marisflavi]|uniref:Crp/Fnr family transcriptional regulator n=1 Tax=Qipengyuania marisflavi TaxID=2486356 RepID=A0A5S3P0T8_9SPHN|nr:Crp/Fnr family transcriptional regulator [Qipengyuania marisflavi]TMM46151.1 Crp/Fnr family transcriptional regulator [Qipengyuania marisflavi]